MDILSSATTKKESYGFKKQFMYNQQGVTDLKPCPSDLTIVYCNCVPIFMILNT